MILTELEQRVALDRAALHALTEEKLASLIGRAQAFYFHGLAASRSGEETIARGLYRSAFDLLPTHIEALDNYAIGLVEELRFADAIPLLEQSACAEPSSPLAFLYLTKCYQETSQNRLALLCIQYLELNWPDKSPIVDWSHLGQPQPEQPLVSPPFSEGQVWGMKTQEGCNQRRIWIRLIELEHGHPVVHISAVDKVRTDELAFISHLPYDPGALLLSELELTDEKQEWGLEDDHFGAGFAMWREAFNAGKAGVFDVPVSVLIDGMLRDMKEQ